MEINKAYRRSLTATIKCINYWYDVYNNEPIINLSSTYHQPIINPNMYKESVHIKPKLMGGYLTVHKMKPHILIARKS